MWICVCVCVCVFITNCLIASYPNNFTNIVLCVCVCLPCGFFKDYSTVATFISKYDIHSKPFTRKKKN